MNNENQDEQDILKKTDANVDESTDTVEKEDNSNDEQIDYKAEFEKAKQIAENQKIRAEKAEAKLKTNTSTGRGETSKIDGMSPFDLMAVTKANLDEESLREVMDIAKYKKITIAEALKLPMTKAVIAEKEENKRMAEAANTGSARRGTSKTSDETLMANANKGILPESDAEMRRLVQIRKNFR